MAHRLLSYFVSKFGCILHVLIITQSASQEIVGYGGWDIGRLNGDLSHFLNLSGGSRICVDSGNNGPSHFDMKGLITLSLHDTFPGLLPPLPYQIVKEPEAPPSVRLSCSEKELGVADILANVLAKENDEFADLFDVVPVHHTFQLPASWGSRQEKFLRTAAAQVNVIVDIQHRPSAASTLYTAVLAHGLENDHPHGGSRPRHVLVYTFDECVSVDPVTVYEDNRFDVKVNTAPCYLTSTSITAHAKSFLLDMFARRYKVNLSEHFWAMKDFDFQFLMGLNNFLLEPKANLTIDLSIPGFGSRHQGPKCKVVATIEDFDDLIGFDEFFNKLVAMTEQALQRSIWSKADVDAVVIFGRTLGNNQKIRQTLSEHLERDDILVVSPPTSDPSGFDSMDFLETSFNVNNKRIVIDTYEDTEADLLLCKVKDTVADQEEMEELLHIVKEHRNEKATGFSSPELGNLIWQKRDARKGNLHRYSSCWKLMKPSGASSLGEVEAWSLLIEHGPVRSVNLDSKANEFCVDSAVVIMGMGTFLSGALILGLIWYFCSHPQVPSSAAQNEGESDMATVDEPSPVEETEALGAGHDGEVIGLTDGCDRAQGSRRRNQRTRQRFNAARARAPSPMRDDFD